MKKNILIFPCGSEIGLEINRALAGDSHFNLYGASSLSDHGQYVYKNYTEGLPFVDNENFTDEINKLCKKYKIDYIIPAHDSVVLKLAQNTEKLSAELITSPLETCEIARSKKKTYSVLKEKIKCPKTYEISDKNIPFPVFIKPDVGQGSKGAVKVNNEMELFVEYIKNKDIVICEYLPGEEYTVDCFTNRKGELLFAKGRKRNRISNGISVNSFPVENKAFRLIAEKLNKIFKFQGMWFFQLKENADKDLVLMEFAPRIAGTMGLYRGLGINFIQAALYDKTGLDIELFENNFNIEIDRALYACYKTDLNYKNIYMDFDDTILSDKTVNTNIIKFMYQAQNAGKRLILLTKHSDDIYKTLDTYNISKNLFDEIICINNNDEKVNYITKPDSVFIDDSFSERRKVFKEKNIPVFGIDAVETLLDFRN